MLPILEIQNVSKQYRLGYVGTGSLGHDINRWWKTSVRGKEDPYLKIGEENNRSQIGTSEYVWALRDINLQVQQGEVLGIIGANGAGKSTLLKLLSRVTGPTTGKITARGRIASLLEVGTGFHGELTGRENIYLNGAILGMTKNEITSKLDEIIEFSGCERYIDTPVKRYSSGMYVRLAFAVAAHLEPEILIVDEVLAVGDAEFQKKAIGKMKDVSSGQGRTVLFVSHNMGTIRALCKRTVLLDNGKIFAIGNTEEIIKKYYKKETYDNSYYISNKSDGVFIKAVKLINKKSYITDSFDFKELIFLNLEFNFENFPVGLNLTIALINIYKNRIFSDTIEIKKDETNIQYTLPELPYAPGNYSFHIGLHIPNNCVFDTLDDILPFTIIDNGSELSRYNSFTGDIQIKGTYETI